MRKTNTHPLGGPSLLTAAVLAPIASVLVLWVGGGVVDGQDRGQTERGQQRGWDSERFFRQLDTNRSGKLEPNELRGRTGRFVERLGFDPKKPIDIKALQAKINRDRQQAEAEEKSASIERKVPGFGEPVNLPKVPGFSVAGQPTAASSSDWKSKNDPEIVSQVERTLRRYDRNRDNVLDDAEIKAARWGSPDPKSNDTNKDGRLTASELAVRYAQRRQMEARRGREEAIARSSRGDVRDARRATIFRRSRSGSSQSSSSDNRSSGGRGSGASASTIRQYQRYVDGLLRKYDKNGDNKISADEQKDQGYSLPGADSNGDGALERSEILDYFLAKADPSYKSSASKSSNAGDDKRAGETEPETRDGASSRERNRQSSRPSREFNELDADGDGQIQMHEFTKEWTDKRVREFAEKDANGDGIISADEWR